MEMLDNDLKSIQEARILVAKAKEAQAIYREFSEEEINKVMENIIRVIDKEAIRLAKLANQETGFGKWEDKVIKNKFASNIVYNHIKDMKTIGILNDDKENKRSEEHTSELQSRQYLVCRLLLEKKKT